MALLTSLSTVTFVVFNFRKHRTRAYWGSISECGAASVNYNVYSRGMTVSAALLFIGAMSFIVNVIITVKSYGEKVGFGIVFFATILTVVMCVAMAFQGIVKINLTTDSDPHRTGAGIFFLSALVNCWLYSKLFNKAWKPSAFRRAVRYVVLALIVANMYLSKELTQQFNISMSITTHIQSLENAYISKFSYLQYAFIGTLFMGIASVIKFK